MENRFDTRAVFASATGFKGGSDILGLYDVTSFMIGRAAETHDLVAYGDRTEAALRAAFPDIPQDVRSENCMALADQFVAKHGPTIDLPLALEECLADEKSPEDTMNNLGASYKTISVSESGEIS